MTQTVRVHTGLGEHYALLVKSGRKWDHVLMNRPGLQVRVYKLPKGAAEPCDSSAETLLGFIQRNMNRAGATQEAAQWLNQQEIQA